MNLLIVRTLDRISLDLTNLLNKCTSRDDIVMHFSHYMIGQLSQQHVEDYDFFPEITATETIVRVHVYFPWDAMARHELTIRKKDSPTAAYNRAMGVL